MYDAADGITPNSLIRAVLAILGLLIVASVSGFYMGRSLQETARERTEAAEAADA